MEELDYWRLCETLNIVQAAMLVTGEAPRFSEYVEQWDIDKRPVGYEAAKTAISNGLKNFETYCEKYRDLNWEQSGADYVVDNEEYRTSLLRSSIEGELFPESEYDTNGNEIVVIRGSLDLYRSTVNVDSLKRWLGYRGFKTGFFFPDPVETMDFLDAANPRYAPKLAAAVRAWQAVTDAGKKSPKQALDKWLREHAVDFKLTNDEGKPIETAIEECSKVANWNPKGGATKTPG